MTENQSKTNNSLSDSLAPDVDRVGVLLANERKKKDVSLPEISQKLCIRTLYLDAIENGNYSELPPPPYSVGFVNSYARYLGLNADRMVQLFKEELHVSSVVKKKILVVEDLNSEADMPSKRYVFVGIVLFLITLAVWYSVSPSKEDVHMPEELVVSEVEASPEEFNLVEVLPVEDDSAQVQILDAEFVEEKPIKAKTIEVRVVKENTWVEVKNNEKVFISRVMKAGESYILPDEKGLRLSSGKVVGVDVYVDGVKTEVLTPKRKMNIELDEIVNR